MRSALALLAGLAFVVGCNGEQPVQTQPLSATDPDVKLMRTWFLENLDDPQWEEVSISEPVTGGDEKLYDFKIRTHEPQGKVIREYQFIIKSGEVTHVYKNKVTPTTE